MTTSTLTALGLLCWSVLTMRIAAADAAPLPTITFTIQGMRITQDYRPQPNVPALAGNLAMRRQFSDPWGIWRPGIHVRLGVQGPEDWSLISTDQLTATARMDSGEVLPQDARPEQSGGIMSDASSSSNQDSTIWPNQVQHDPEQSTLGLELLLPTRPCRSITSLMGKIRLVLGDLHTLKTVHIIPKRAEPQTVPGTDLAIELTTDGKVSFGYTAGTLKELHDVQLLSADGSSLAPNSSGSNGNNDHQTMTFGTSKPVAVVDLHFYQHYRAVMTEFTFSDLSLASVNDPSLLSRPSTTMNEIAMPTPAPASAPAANPTAAPPGKKSIPSF